ncbi:MAG: hypothetical protein DMG39_06345 [Acidobacteria bacterium]|nr:MAG: hypothetical protein DMG39_06345 [Acidobacteriota bacterium]
MIRPPTQNFLRPLARFLFTSRSGLSTAASFSSASPNGRTKSANPQNLQLPLRTQQRPLMLRSPTMPPQKTPVPPKTRTKTSSPPWTFGTGATSKSCPNKNSTPRTTARKTCSLPGTSAKILSFPSARTWTSASLLSSTNLLPFPPTGPPTPWNAPSAVLPRTSLSSTFPPAHAPKFRMASTTTTTSKKVPPAATSSISTTTTIGPSTPPHTPSSTSPKTPKLPLWIANPTGPSSRSRPSALLVGPRMTPRSSSTTNSISGRLRLTVPWIDTSKPIYLSLFGIRSKKSGFARLQPGASGALTEEHLVLLDKSLDRLAKAKDADVFEYVQQTFVESPNAFIAGPDLKSAKAVTKTNPFQSNYAWGREELIEYKNSHNERLQGALFYPAGYDSSKKYPMIIYMYEKLSDGLHRYSAPSERNYYNVTAMNSHGYFVLEPDILFKPRDPGVSVVDCVTAAAKRVIQMGVIDAKKIGIMGHSWGGFDTTYLATHTTNFFAAAVAGAPITDLVSNYGNHHWSSGIAETDHIETGQQRMEVPLYEDLQAYIRNSAVFGVSSMTTPLLIEVGDSDGTVFFHQGVELYNIARRARKDVVLIEYAGEDHGLRKKANQVDYQRRIFQWFGHYLKDEPTPLWISKGETYLDHERELKKLKAASAKN